MASFSRVRSSVLIFVVIIDRTFSNNVILVNYERDLQLQRNIDELYRGGILCLITNSIAWTKDKTDWYCPFRLRRREDQFDVFFEINLKTYTKITCEDFLFPIPNIFQ